MVEKLTPLNPAFFEVNTPVARAYQLRYLARRAISDLDSSRAASLSRAWVSQSRLPLIEEPVKSFVTLAAAAVLSVFGRQLLHRIMQVSARLRRAEAV